MKKKVIYLLVAGAIAGLTGCIQTVYRTASGLTFMIYKGPDTGGIASGSGTTVKVELTVRHGDSVVQTSVGKMPVYQQLIPGLIFPYSPAEALVSGVKAGDSLVVWQQVDSMLQKGLLRQLPKGWERSDQLVSTIKVLQVFPFDFRHGDSLVKTDKEAEAKAWLGREQTAGETRVKDWLAKQGITAKPGPEGSFLVVVNKGQGPPADSGVALILQYRCSTLDGKLLDSNMDTAFHRPAALRVVVGARMLPKVLDSALRGMPVGSHLRLYVPGATDLTPAAVATQGGIVGEDRVWEVWF
jgi:FKBP-type peptidyl-prolyl cis-trans isomerase